jgi:aminoglycoside phosphotransferase (APT) family kinase protein
LQRHRAESSVAAVVSDLARAGAHRALGEPRARRWAERVAAQWQALGGASRPSALSHADFTAANILFTGDRVSGVIDWASGSRSGFPLVDHFTLAYYLRTKRFGVPRARAVAQLLGGDRSDVVGVALEQSLDAIGDAARLRGAAVVTTVAIRAVRALAAGRVEDADALEAALATAAPGGLEAAS